MDSTETRSSVGCVVCTGSWGAGYKPVVSCHHLCSLWWSLTWCTTQVHISGGIMGGCPPPWPLPNRWHVTHVCHMLCNCRLGQVPACKCSTVLFQSIWSNSSCCIAWLTLLPSAVVVVIHYHSVALNGIPFLPVVTASPPLCIYSVFLSSSLLYSHLMWPHCGLIALLYIQKYKCSVKRFHDWLKQP